MIYLGIDYGKKKIGLSLAEDIIAQPLKVVPNKESSFQEIAQICTLQSVKKIIIGLPEGPLAEEIKKFSNRIALLTSLPIEFESETLTTQEAIGRMIAAGKSRKSRQLKEDAAAAAIILQNYLNR